MKITQAMSLEDRMSIRVEPVPEAGCWIWTGYTDDSGYGTLRAWGKKRKAHRVSWVMANGEIPDGLLVCHKCDTPSCVNPAHLFLGSDADNCADKHRKGRARTGKSLGEAHGSAKLTMREVLEIRQSVGSHAEIARRFGVSRSCVTRILAGKAWTHV